MMEARETEFKGKLYRSKTEAMFAFIIDQSFKEKGQRYRLIYEPEKYKTPNDYIPDFELTYVEEPFLADFTSLYEVKPARPTQAYINHLEKQFQWIKAKDHFESVSFYCLYVFNPYNRIFEYILFDFETSPIVDDFEQPLWFKEHWFDLALKYRFDLEPDF